MYALTENFSKIPQHLSALESIFLNITALVCCNRELSIKYDFTEDYLYKILQHLYNFTEDYLYNVTAFVWFNHAFQIIISSGLIILNISKTKLTIQKQKTNSEQTKSRGFLFFYKGALQIHYTMHSSISIRFRSAPLRSFSIASFDFVRKVHIAFQ